MDENTHVYCTNCKNFKVNLNCLNEGLYVNAICCKTCKCYGCDCGDLEDSRPFKERCKYEKL